MTSGVSSYAECAFGLYSSLIPSNVGTHSAMAASSSGSKRTVTRRLVQIAELV